jgi:2-polyprenyl-3-methyl-5-hydroxy-6-metoxy-1,4-benzoquinol methylase
MKTDRIAQRFNQRARRYDNPWTAFIGERELCAIRRVIPPGVSVLDYGCGTGRTTLDLLRRGCTVTAFDISAAMLEIAHHKAQREGLPAEFVADETKISGRVWSFITCIGVLDYYIDPVPVLRRVSGYLQPAGRLVVTFPNGLSPLAWTYALTSRLTTPAHTCTPRRARSAAQRAGLDVVTLQHAFPALPALGLTLVLETTIHPAGGLGTGGQN